MRRRDVSCWPVFFRDRRISNGHDNGFLDFVERLGSRSISSGLRNVPPLPFTHRRRSGLEFGGSPNIFPLIPLDVPTSLPFQMLWFESRSGLRFKALQRARLHAATMAQQNSPTVDFINGHVPLGLTETP